VFRDESTSAISIEIDGKRYHKLTDIHDPQTGRQLLQTVADLGRFIHRITPVAKTVASSVRAEEQPIDASSTHRHAQQNGEAPEPGSLAKRGEALIANTSSRQHDPESNDSDIGGLLGRTGGLKGNSTSPQQASPAGPAQPPHEGVPVGSLRLPPRSAEEKRDVGTFWGRVLSPVQSSDAVGPRPLADELEDILKGLTDSGSDKPDRDVHFRTAIDGSLIIDVDGTSYENLADITDSAAQQIIRAVIRKWEKE
jgi:hypothetical protein